MLKIITYNLLIIYLYFIINFIIKGYRRMKLLFVNLIVLNHSPGGNPYAGFEMNEQFVAKLKSGLRLSKPNVCPDKMYANLFIH